jgi:hypothetical protein
MKNNHECRAGITCEEPMNENDLPKINRKKLVKYEPKPMILKLETYNWNKTPKKDQDKAIEFMLRVVRDLERGRKFGFDDRFYATYP